MYAIVAYCAAGTPHTYDLGHTVNGYLLFQLALTEHVREHNPPTALLSHRFSLSRRLGIKRRKPVALHPGVDPLSPSSWFMEKRWAILFSPLIIPLTYIPLSRIWAAAEHGCDAHYSKKRLQMRADDISTTSCEER